MSTHIVQASDYVQFEDELSNFLNSVPEISIINISYAITTLFGRPFYSALVVYKGKAEMLHG